MIRKTQAGGAKQKALRVKPERFFVFIYLSKQTLYR